MNPRHPVYVISKGRWETPWTINALVKMCIPFSVVIEPQEFDNYAAIVDPKKILVLPFSNLGLGSIPARNWVWEHSVEQGAHSHWILDDNILGFIWLTNNVKHRVQSGGTFCAIEDMTARYDNVALAGMQYEFLAPRRQSLKPIIMNTRIYSCILIRNDIPYHWRGKYNEDTDLSIRALKDGWCTMLFTAFLADKCGTMKTKGGNTNELYQGDGRYDMARSLQLQHPGIVQIKRRWNRWQHVVDYKGFRRNQLQLRPGVAISNRENNYGMVLPDL